MSLLQPCFETCCHVSPQPPLFLYPLVHSPCVRGLLSESSCYRLDTFLVSRVLVGLALGQSWCRRGKDGSCVVSGAPDGVFPLRGVCSFCSSLVLTHVCLVIHCNPPILCGGAVALPQFVCTWGITLTLGQGSPCQAASHGLRRLSQDAGILLNFLLSWLGIKK